MFRVLSTIAGLAMAAFSSVQPAWSVEVYFFRGAGDLSYIKKDLHFSLGLDEMAAILKSEGIHTEVRRFEEVPDALATIRARKPGTIALIGHSMGALASLDIAKTLQRENIRIVYMGLIDIPGHFSSVTSNVEWVEDYYSDNPAFGRLTNAASHPRSKAIHISGYMHNRLDDVPALKQAMLTAVREVHAADIAPTFRSEPAWVANTQPENSGNENWSGFSDPIQLPSAGRVPGTGQEFGVNQPEPPVIANEIDRQTTAATRRLKTLQPRPTRRFSQR